MNPLYPLLAAQFLSAFADNAILFAAIAMVLQAGQSGGWYIPALQSSFLVAFVFLAPWVGRLADLKPKPSVLVIGNAIKLLGAGLILVGVDPLFAYGIVGVGAAVYGPAKYGILPELMPPEELVKANGWMEGSTILAIVLGTVVGAKIADHSIHWALVMVVASFGVSIGFTLLLPKLAPRGGEEGQGGFGVVTGFGRRIGGFFDTARARFAMLGAGLFWASAAVLRVLIVAWAPIALGATQSSDIAGLTLFLAIGIMIGAALAPRLIPLEGLRRARLAGYGMGVCVALLAFAERDLTAHGLLLAAGVAGGLFVVPINATLQEIGHRSIGAGGAVAIQNFFENLAMLAAVGLYTLSTTLDAQPAPSLLALGVAIILATLTVSWHLPKDVET